jgi:polar amino acid transport system substrate-binding protein
MMKLAELARWIVVIAMVAVWPASVSMSGVPSALPSELAPTGKVRVGLILSYQVLGTKDPATGELRGVTISLGKALATRVGVSFEPVGYANPAALVTSFGAHEGDIAFLASDPDRAREVEFSPPYMEVDNSYVVLGNSKVQAVESAARPGGRIAVPERSAPDLFLSRNLKAAEVVRVPGGLDVTIDVRQSGQADAYAENAHMLMLYTEQLLRSRVLGGRYTVIRHAIATPKGKTAAAEDIKRFVEEAKQDETVSDAIRRAGLRRVSVGSPAETR